MRPTRLFDVFSACVDAITQGVLIDRVSRSDKEFHFQNWFENRLRSTGVLFDKSGRNSYPDFTLVEFAEGYETKGLAWPGRESTYDCNSQVPTGPTTDVTFSMSSGATPRLKMPGESTRLSTS